MTILSLAPIRNEATPKLPPHDPSCVVQRAWSVLRLTRLQELIRLTITELESLPRSEPGELELASAPPPSSPSSLTQAALHQRSPVMDALRAVCDELRDAAGMSGANSERIAHCRTVRDYMQQQPPGWAASFTRALDEYRRAAAVALEASVARAAV